MKPEELIRALIDGDISPQEFKQRAQEVELPPPPKFPPWMEGEKPRSPARPMAPSERLPWENLPAWLDEC